METIQAVSAAHEVHPVQAGIAGLVGILAIFLVPTDALGAVVTSTAWVVMLWLLRIVSFESVLFTVMGVILAVDTGSPLAETLAVPAAAFLGLSLMYSSLRRHQWHLGTLRVALCILLVAPGIALLVSNPSTAAAGTALFAVLLAGAILAQMAPEWPLGAGLTCLGLCAVFLAIGWMEIASQIANAAFFSLLAASVLTLARKEYGE